MARIFIPVQMRDLTAGESEVEIPGRNLRQIIAALDQKFPGVAARLVEGDRIAPGLAISIDNEVTSLGLLARVGEDSVVHILPAIAGG